MLSRRSLVVASLAAALVAVPLSARTAPPPSDAPAEITVAYQPGLSYSNLIVMRDQRSLEKQFPQTKINWVVLNSTAAVREGFIAGQIQIGAGSIPPFLTGWERGVGWKVLASLNQMSVWLVTRDKNVRTLKDLKPDMKIGMPSVDSLQSLTLRKAALDQLGNAHALDNAIVAIDHPSGLQALLVGQLAAHLSAPPFQYQEVQAGGHVLVRSFDVFGKHTFNSVYVNEKFANEHPQFVKTFYRDLLDATQFLKAHPREASEILAKDAGSKVPARDFESWLRRPDVIFSTTPHGFLAMAKFMQSIGSLKNVPSSMRDIDYAGTLGSVGD
ncbi:MAG: ABC transporter substrate-binding protein [Candidatus Eremiobacteraeota bacterium]|nr:ABC transporter substrate-binding protein [Candidatus Eremiobacteraeota bacterium]